MNGERIGDFKTYPFRGGCNTYLEVGQLPSGGYSMIQNMRNTHPGFVKRLGCTKQHSTADSTNKAMSIYQFSKGKQTERHTFAQFSDGDVLEATTAPPGVTTGAFGSEVYSGTATGLIAASWSNINDAMVFSDGSDQHQIYYGATEPVHKFIVFRGAAAPPTIPDKGEDWTQEVTDGLSTTAAPLDSLGDLSADYDCIFVMTPVPIGTLTWTVSAANGTAATMLCKYWKGSWNAVASFTDNTTTDSKTLAKSGTMTWTVPTDSYPNFMFGACGYWYQIYIDTGGDLDAETEVSAVTFTSTWQSLVNVWDGALVEAIEAQFYDQSATVYKSFSSSLIEIDSMTSSDALYFSSYDPIVGFYVDVGSTPNTVTSLTMTGKYWDGNAWQALTITDETACFNNSGFVTFAQTADHPQNFNATQYYAHWYQITVSNTLSSDVQISIDCMPYFDIEELGKGRTNCAWKNRVSYSFSLWPSYVYLTTTDAPLSLNGSDYGIIEVGDGRSNKIVAQRKFHNELMVWQEEKGEEGGCLTLLEGYSPTTFGKLILSSKLGAMNAKCVDVVDGVLVSTATDETIKTLAFALSRYGVYATDGKVCWIISDDIRDRFDPTDTTNCIRFGYESEMWLKYDSAYNVLRLGLVCGSSATLPNVFPVFDLTDKVWSFDSLGQEFSCLAEVEAGSGNIPVLQLGGGIDDGYVYLSNYGSNDVSTAIDSYATLEFDNGGKRFNIREMLLRCKSQSAGNITATPYVNGQAGTAKTISMTAATAGDNHRRHRMPWNLTGDHISLKIQNATASQSIYLIDYAPKFISYEGQ